MCDPQLGRTLIELRKFRAMSCPLMHTHIPTCHVCVRVVVRTCVRGFVFVNNYGLLSVTLAFWDPIPSENTVKTFMGMYACVRPCTCACVCVHMFTRRAQVCARARWNNIIMAALDTCSAVCPTHYSLSYDRKCISPQHFCSSFSVYEILYSTELLRKFREIVMSFSRKQSTQTYANGFSNIGEFCKIVTSLMSEWQACICCYLVKYLTQQYIQYSLYHAQKSHITLKLYLNTGSFVG